MSALERLKQLERLYLCGAPYESSLSLETLLDSLVCLYDECCSSTLRREKSIAEFVDYARPTVSQVKALRLSRDDFDVLKVIGRGSFGEVAVVKLKNTDKVYAMKILNKWEMLKRAETACFKEERDVMVFGDRQWITNIHFAFQDEKNLYLVMEYYVGGDLLTLLSKFEVRLPESMTRFYAAEMILAIDSVHRLGYVHRDIKPDNILLDRSGHIKLGDFGSCLKRLEDGTVRATTAVGTPDYISPETLRAVESGHETYGAECDWWSLGICMYEMLFGETPFYADSLVDTYGQIMNHEQMFEFPDDIEISEAARDLVSKLICARERRLGKNGLEDFRNHPFFEGIDWENIRNATAPYVPEVSSETDTSNFDEFENDFTPVNTQPPNVTAAFTGHHLPFVGFTYTHGSQLSDMCNLVDATTLESVDNGKSDKLDQLERERNDLQRQISEVLGATKNDESETIIAQLKDEIQILKRRLEDDANLARPVKDVNVEEMEKKLKELKDKNRQLILEKQDLQRELEDNAERLTTVITTQSESGQELEKLKAQLTQTEEALEEEKNTRFQLENELNHIQQTFKQLSERTESLESDNQKLKATAEEAELRSEQLEKDLDAQKIALRVLQTKLDVESSKGDEGEEVKRLNQELQKLQEHSNELRAAEEKKRAEIVENYRKEVDELHARLKKQAQEYEEGQWRLEQQHGERVEKLEGGMNKKIRGLEVEVAELKEENDTLKVENQNLEQRLQNTMPSYSPEEMEELLRMVSDGRESRDHLQGLVSRLAADVESLAHQSKSPQTPNGQKQNLYSNTPYGTNDKAWGSRRMTKQAKYGRFEAQQQLEAEIRAKQQVQEDLRKMRTKYDEMEKNFHMTRRRVAELERYESECQVLRERQNYEMSPTSNHLMNPSFFNTMNQNELGPAYGSFKTPSERRLISEYESPVQRNLNYMQSNPSYENTFSSASPLASFYAASTPEPQHRPKAHPKSVQSINNALNGKGHKFAYAVLRGPTKCGYCSSILVGLDRQGMICQDCHIPCHVNCVSKIPNDCPIAEKDRRPLGIDPQKGKGTAYEGFVKTPKPAGIKKGWLTTYVVVCDFKLFLYDCVCDKHGKAVQVETNIRQVFDMKDPEFRVDKVTENDAIHASKSELPRIFKVTCSQVCGPPNGSDTMGSQSSNSSTSSPQSPLRQYALLMADTKEEAYKWTIALCELKAMSTKTNLEVKTAYGVKELVDMTALPMLKTAHCGALIDNQRFVVGFQDCGLMCVELEKETITPVGGEKENNKRFVEKVEYDQEEQLLVAIVGNQKDRHVRLIPTAALDGRELKWIKVADTKGCHLICVGSGAKGQQRTEPSANGAPVPTQVPNQSAPHYFAVAVQKSVIVYEINRLEKRHHRLRDFAMPALPQTMRIIGGRLYVGYMSGFRVWDLLDNSQTSLVNLEDGSLQFLNKTLYDARLLVPVDDSDLPSQYLLVFNNMAVYVDAYGHRSAPQEIMFPCKVGENGFAYHAPYLCLYSEYEIDVFHVPSGEWVQTINLRKARPLSGDGLLSLCYVNDMPYLIYLSSLLEAPESQLYVPPTCQSTITSAKGVQKRRRKFSVRTARDDSQSRSDRRSALPISGPSGFVHVVHMGPGSVHDLQNHLMDLRSPNSTNNTGNTSGYSSEKTRYPNIQAVQRSASASASSQHGLGAVLHQGYHHSLQQQRPLSSHSRNSDGSSLGKDSRYRDSSLSQSNITVSSSTIGLNDSMDSYYLEPISSTRSANSSTPNALKPLQQPPPPPPPSQAPPPVPVATTVSCDRHGANPSRIIPTE
ncbi:unnamed protein product [Bursaphelenchus okinawaensis]|uniref:non-specific serine/threonine protein kinase n=1 Tax=Bursaphelenchus okinawaensis TaxID=465554 RepID=A0A811LEJ7_9BILA|nr:unnamed protein product [Bursaphelenchus okinawaensis]CAG9121110.1 unnamed protein product [Bursaphelenchus okinawaensis]